MLVERRQDGAFSASYRIFWGPSPQSPSKASYLSTTSLTWSQLEQWVGDNYGTPDGLDLSGLTQSGADGAAPLLNYASNFAAGERQVLTDGADKGSRGSGSTKKPTGFASSSLVLRRP